MPELPELQALAEALDGRLRGRRITVAPVVHFAVLKTATPPLAGFAGVAVAAVRRRGKHLVVDGDHGASIAIHLMTMGRAGVPQGKVKVTGPEVLALELDDGARLVVTERGTRKSVRIGCYDAVGLEALFAHLGPEPLDPAFGPDQLRAILDAAPRQVNALLRDGRAIAGVGRAFADEILHAAGLSPFAISNRLDDDAVDRLHDAIVTVLTRALDHCRARQGLVLPAKNDVRPLRIHGHAGEPCPACETTLEFIDFESNRIVYCPRCQTDGRKLADRRMSRLLR